MLGTTLPLYILNNVSKICYLCYRLKQRTKTRSGISDTNCIEKEETVQIVTQRELIINKSVKSSPFRMYD